MYNLRFRDKAIPSQVSSSSHINATKKSKKAMSIIKIKDSCEEIVEDKLVYNVSKTSAVEEKSRLSFNRQKVSAQLKPLPDVILSEHDFSDHSPVRNLRAWLNSSRTNDQSKKAHKASIKTSETQNAKHIIEKTPQNLKNVSAVKSKSHPVVMLTDISDDDFLMSPQASQPLSSRAVVSEKMFGFENLLHFDFGNPYVNRGFVSSKEHSEIKKRKPLNSTPLHANSWNTRRSSSSGKKHFDMRRTPIKNRCLKSRRPQSKSSSLTTSPETDDDKCKLFDVASKEVKTMSDGSDDEFQASKAYENLKVSKKVSKPKPARKNVKPFQEQAIPWEDIMNHELVIE